MLLERLYGVVSEPLAVAAFKAAVCKSFDMPVCASTVASQGCAESPPVPDAVNAVSHTGLVSVHVVPSSAYCVVHSADLFFPLGVLPVTGNTILLCATGICKIGQGSDIKRVSPVEGTTGYFVGDSLAHRPLTPFYIGC